MSLLVSPLANLIGDGHAVDSDEYLDFFEIDENTYPRTYLFLKAQRTILESIQQQIAKLKASKDINLDFVEYLTESLLYSIFGEVFDRAKSLIPTIRKFIDNIDHQNNQVHGMKSNQNRSNNFPSNISISEPVEVQKICQKLLSCAIALSRVFSVIACSLPTKTPDGEDITPEINYTPDINEVLVVCRICEEYVPLSLIESHSKNCAKACESEIRIMSLDDRIEKLQQSIIKIILKPIWPGNKDSCINVLLPMFHVVMLLDKALKAKTSSILDAQVLSVIMTSLHQIKIRIDNQNIESMLAKARELINEKLKVCTTKTDATYILNMIHSQNQQKVSPIIEVTIADFELIKAISSGAYARVFLGMKKKTGDIYAIKVIPKSSLSQKNQIQRILTEKDILLQNENPYIVNFYYSIIGQNNLYLIMEFLPGGDLYSLLQNVGSLDEESTRTYVAQIVLALRSLHARGIIHRDIKPDNILITETGKLKLTDFGLSMFGSADRHISEDELGSKTENESSQIIGTPDYLAPEIILSQPHTFTADYFSLGAVIYELLTGVPPFHRDTESETFSAIVIGKVDWSELDECSPEVKSLVAGLLVADPEKRLGANGINEIMNHPWFNGIDWENLDLLDPPFVPQIDDKQSTDYFQQRYQMNQQADADIIEDINNAKSQIGQNTYNDDLKDFTSIDFKSLSKTNCAVAKKMRNDNNFRIEKCDSDLDMKALSAKSFTLRSINPTQVHRISSVSFMPNSLSNVLQGQL